MSSKAMQGFDYLPRSTQIRRMRRLVQSALTAYGFEQVHITPLHHFLNTTFRIDIPAQKQRYVLRISRAGYQDAATINSSANFWAYSMGGGAYWRTRFWGEGDNQGEAAVRCIEKLAKLVASSLSL